VFRRDTKAVSPAISTVIITSAVVVMVLVAMVYANGYLDSRLAQNEFTTNKQFMLTTGLQIDDIAWTMGRTQTVRYSSIYAQLDFEPQALSYSIEINQNGAWEPVNMSLPTGVILFNMPIHEYTLGNNYFERIFPSSDSAFLQVGPSAPVSQVYVMEKLPMAAGNFTRVVVAPSIRELNSTIGSRSYVKFYLPLLTAGANPHLSQSITLIGKNVMQYIRSDVQQVRFKVDFPKADQGFDSGFFPFEYYEEIVDLPPNTVVEFYVGEVTVSLGLHV
jgi:hypothetical protein